MELGAARECKQSEFSKRIGGTGERAFYVLFDSVRIVPFAFVDCARFVGIEIGIGKAIAPQIEQAECVIKIVVVPIDGRGVEVSALLAGENLGNAFPVGSGLRKLIVIGVDVANAR